MLFNKILKKIASCESTGKEVLFECSNITSHNFIIIFTPEVKGLSKILQSEFHAEVG